MKNKLSNFVKKLWALGGNKVFHTFWQAAGGVLIASLLAAHNSTDVKGAVVVAAAAGLAAVKAVYLARR